MNRPPRLSRRTARRLLDGRPAVRAREQRLGYLLEALGERDASRGAAVPAQLLEAFTRHARDAASSAVSQGGGRARPTRSGARSGSRSRRIGRALTVKAAFVLAFSGATVAATAADALPAPAQSAVHELLGSWGVPAPSQGIGRTHAAVAEAAPSAPNIPNAPNAPSTPAAPPASHPAARAPSAPAGKDRPSSHTSGSHPATPTADCAPFDSLRKGRVGLDSDSRLGPGTGAAAVRVCTGEPGLYPSGRAGGGSADAATGGATGGESAKKRFGRRPSFDLGRRRTHGPRHGKSEH